MLPYAERLGRVVPPWTFDVEGVTSISVDLHKYAYTPKGASLLLHRDPSLRRAQYFASADWPGYTMLNSTFQSTKSGGPLAAAWAVVTTVGDAGYERLARTAFDGHRRRRGRGGARSTVSRWSRRRTRRSSRWRPTAPCDVFTIADEMAARGWYVQPQLSFGGHGPTLHLTLSAATDVDGFLEALAGRRRRGEAGRSGAGRRRTSRPSSPPSTRPRSATTSSTASSPPRASRWAGPDLALPERMAGVNALLDLAPPRLREAVLLAFLDRLYRPVRSS